MKEPLLPKSVLTVIERLNSAGYRADIVGGCVRDFLLGKTPSDYDVTTNATPETTVEIFSDLRTVKTGIKHGTVTVIFDGEPIEVTTYRKDGEYRDHRHPTEVTFTDALCDDLSRRDFTMNAICYNPCDGFTDVFCGKEDIKSRTVRAVGAPECRFEEDALRILRAIRFSSVLGFEVEEKTRRALKEKKHLLSLVSKERIAAEWKKLIDGVGAYGVISEYSDTIAEFLPLPLKLRLPKEKSFALMNGELRELSLFFLNSQSPSELFALAAKDLKYDNSRSKKGKAVLEILESKMQLNTDVDVKLLLKERGEEYSLCAISLGVLLGAVEKETQQRLIRVIKRRDPYRISDLAVTGDDLVKLGIEGIKLGRTLEFLVLEVINLRVENTPDALIPLAKSFALGGE